MILVELYPLFTNSKYFYWLLTSFDLLGISTCLNQSLAPPKIVLHERLPSNPEIYTLLSLLEEAELAGAVEHTDCISAEE